MVNADKRARGPFPHAQPRNGLLSTDFDAPGRLNIKSRGNSGAIHA